MTDKGTGLSGASDRIRETAKWFAIGVAALGGVVAAGSQLTDIGKLDADSGRLWLAVLGGIVAVAGALLILWVVVDTMTGRAIRLQGIASETPSGAEKAVVDPTLLGGYDNVKAVQNEYLEAVNARRTAYEEARNHPGDGDKVTVANLSDNRFVAIDQVVGRLLEVVSYLHLAHTWKKARIWILIGSAAAALGLGVFAWAANPPPDAAASMAAANVLATPAPGQAQLTAAGMRELRQSVGESCWSADADTVTVQVLILGMTAAGPDILINQSGCNQVRLLLGSRWGTVIE